MKGLGVRQRGANLRELAYRLVDLAVENCDDGAKFGFAAALQLHAMMRAPSDIIGFAAASGALPCAARRREVFARRLPRSAW